MWLLTRQIIKVLAKILLHNEVESKLGSFFDQNIKDDQVLINQLWFLSIPLCHLLTDCFLEVKEVLQPIGTGALRETILR